MPRIKLDPEDGSPVSLDEAAGTVETALPSHRALSDEGELDPITERAEDSAMPLPSVPFSQRIAEVVTKALAGELRLGRTLQPWEPKALNPMHVNMVLDRASGLRPNEIATKYGISLTRVSIILNHPASLQVYNAVLSTAADNIADPRKRIESYAEEALDVKMDLLRDSETSRNLRDRIASDILDRAGYGARRQLDVDVQHSMNLPVHQAALLTQALDESNRVATVDYSRYLAKPSEAVGEQPRLSGAGHTDQTRSELAPSPAAASEGDSDEDLVATLSVRVA